MSLITAAIVTQSELTIRRAPIEFLEIELAILEEMGLTSPSARSTWPPTGTPGWSTSPSSRRSCASPIDKIHPMPFPGLNIDNLPFFAVIAATAEGKTIIHDWVYENRAIYLTELNRLGARVQLLDPHRIIVEGPTRWRGQQVVCPPALRPAVCILLGMLAARGRVGAARRLRDQPRLRGPGQPAQRPRRQHRGLPRLSAAVERDNVRRSGCQRRRRAGSTVEPRAGPASAQPTTSNVFVGDAIRPGRRPAAARRPRVDRRLRARRRPRRPYAPSASGRRAPAQQLGQERRRGQVAGRR